MTSKVSSNTTRPAFRLDYRAGAISGAPSIQTKTYGGQNSRIPTDTTYAIRGGPRPCLRLLLRTVNILKSSFIRLVGPRPLLFLGDTMVFDRWRWLKSRLPPPPASLIDVGCGNGWLALNCSRLGYRTLGISWDGQDLQKARKRAADLG